MSPVFLTSEIFDDRKFSKHRTDHVQSFSALWDKRFPTEISDLPFLSQRCFHARIYLKHGGIPYENFRRCTTKFFQLKLVICRSYPYDFAVPDFSETQKVSPTMFFDTVRHQLFDGKLWCPLFFYPRIFSMQENSWNIERTKYQVIRHCETKDFQRKLVISPSYRKDVSMLEFIWNTEGSPTKFFGAVRQHFSNWN